MLHNVSRNIGNIFFSPVLHFTFVVVVVVDNDDWAIDYSILLLLLKPQSCGPKSPNAYVMIFFSFYVVVSLFENRGNESNKRKKNLILVSWKLMFFIFYLLRLHQWTK